MRPGAAGRTGRTLFAWAVAACVLSAGGPAAAQGVQRVQDPGAGADTLPDPDAVVRMLRPGPERAEGIERLGELAAGLPPERATLWLRLLSALERLDEEEGHLAARAVRRADAGDGAGALELLGSEPRGATLAALGAHVVDAVDPAEGARLRAELLERWPDALEAAEARFLLARYLLTDPETRGEGIALLEAFLVERPNHPLAPEARRLRMGALRP